MSVYNKLVRDKILKIIESDGKTHTSRILDIEEFGVQLKRKLNEEISEYQSAATDSECIEELADVLEIIHALVDVHGSSMEQLEEVRKNKAEKRGGFKKRIFLKEVIEKDEERI